MTPLIDDEIRRLVGKHARLRPQGGIVGSASLNDLHLDSLDIIDLALAIERAFALPAQDWADGGWGYEASVADIIADTREALAAKTEGGRS